MIFRLVVERCLNRVACRLTTEMTLNAYVAVHGHDVAYRLVGTVADGGKMEHTPVGGHDNINATIVKTTNTVIRWKHPLERKRKRDKVVEPRSPSLTKILSEIPSLSKTTPERKQGQSKVDEQVRSPVSSVTLPCSQSSASAVMPPSQTKITLEPKQEQPEVDQHQLLVSATPTTITKSSSAVKTPSPSKLSLHNFLSINDRPLELQLPPSPQKAPTLSKKSSMKNARLAHSVAVTGQNTICTMCKLNFASIEYLMVHWKHKHGSRDMKKRPFKCVQCARAYADACSLRRHVRGVHLGERGAHVCATCERPFATPSHLAIHVRKHTGQRPFVCAVCKFAFAHQSTLNAHTRTQHTLERPFKCAHCDAAFTLSSYLRTHTNTVHMGIRAFACGVCDRRFGQATHVRRHQLTAHTLLTHSPHVTQIT